MNKEGNEQQIRNLLSLAGFDGHPEMIGVAIFEMMKNNRELLAEVRGLRRALDAIIHGLAKND